MSLGLEGAFGADALSQQLRQRVLEQEAAKQQAFRNALELRSADRADAQQRILQQEHDAALAERARTVNEAFGEKTATNLGSGQTVLSPSGPTAQTLLGAPSLRPLIQADQTLPSTQIASGMAAPGSSDTSTAPAVTAQAPQITGQLRFMGLPALNKQAADTAALSQIATNPQTPPSIRGYLRANPEAKGVPYELFKEQDQPLEQVATPTGPKYVPRNQAVGQTPYHVPQQAATVTIQTQDPNTGKDVTRVLTKAEALKEGTFAGKTSATLDTRLASAKAVTQTGQDIINQVSDPKIAAQLGVAMGRYNNLLDFVGNPPPEFAKLAGEIESYSLANMGVHGMRSANGAEAIKGTLGLGRHTPESIIAIIQGLNGFANHLMENEGRNQSQSAPAGPPMSAEDLIKKYGR